ncbi:MAG TPA: polysaccharide deacetylase family protein, partial [Kofleriaceae bacterium]|nr:polysaccharide deacetylase family protein [Kofleriaceae bacterium]
MKDPGLWKPALRYGREVLKAKMAAAFADTGLIDLMSRVRTVTLGPRVHVLGYHRVVDHLDVTGRGSPVNPALCITTDAFRRQMEQVRERFDVLSLDEAMRAIDGELHLERDACAITFDDGYHDVFARAHPVLAELDLPATVFVPTGPATTGAFLPHDRLYAAFWQALRTRRPLAGAEVGELAPWLARAEAAARLDGPAAAVDLLIAEQPAAALDRIADALERHLGGALPLDSGARVLDPTELRALSDAGWEIGAHTVSHVVLTHEPLERVRHELERPRQDLEAWTGRRCRFFAYCNGLHSRAVVDAARRAG